MARNKTVDLLSATRAPFLKRSGQSIVTANTANSGRLAPWSKDNGFEDRYRNNANTDDIRVASVNSSDRILFAESAALYDRKTITFSLDDNASISTQAFFIADQAYRVAGVTWFHRTQSSVSGTAYVEKTPSGTAPGSGTSLMSGTFDLHAIANATVTSATLATTGTGDSDAVDLQLAAGDALSVVIAGTITSLVGVQVTVTLAPGGVCRTVTFSKKATADLVQNQTIFVANRPYVVTRVDMRWSTKSSVAGLKLEVTKDTGTTAAGGGTALLTDNTSAGVLVTQTANTTYTGALVATAATIRLGTGDRLALAFSGATLTALVGLVVTVTLAEVQTGRKEVTFSQDHVVGAADLVGLTATAFFTADRDYEVLDVREIHDVVGADASAVTVDVTAESGTTAPGSGTTVLNAVISVKATARTTQVPTLAVLGNRFLLAGDRLSLKPAGVFTSAKGLAVTVSLAPR